MAQAAGGPHGRANFRFTWRGGQFKNVFDDAVAEALADSAQAMEQDAKERVHVVTGQLRDSIRSTATVRGGRVTAILSASAPYALYEEIGTAFRPGHPYLRPALDAESDRIRGRIRSAAKRRGL